MKIKGVEVCRNCGHAIYKIRGVERCFCDNVKK